MPCLDILISLFYIPGAKLGLKIGTTYSNLLMLLFHFISFILLIYGNKLYILILSLSLLGIGSGLSRITYMRNCWKFFPKNQGIVNGVILSSSGLASTLLSVLADFVIVNPNKEKTIDGIYPKQVAENVETFIIMVVVFLGAFDIIACILTFDYEKLPELYDEKMRQINENRLESLTTIDINLSSESTELEKEKHQINDELSLKNSLLSLTNLKLLAIQFFGYCKFYYFIILLVLDYFIVNCYRDFGNRNNVPQTYLYIAVLFFNLINGFSRFIWGIFNDIFGFKKLLFLITIIEIFVGLSIYFVVNYEYIYVIELLLVGICLGGIATIISPTYNKIFSLLLGPELHGIAGIFIAVANILGPLCFKLTSKDVISYMIFFIIGAVLCATKLIILYFFDENQKLYENKINDIHMSTIIPINDNDNKY